MYLRGDQVLVRVTERGDPVIADGRVEIRYKADAPKAYRASSANLLPVVGAAILPDEHCVDLSASGTGARAATSSPARTSEKKQGNAVALAPVDGATVIAYADGACSGNPGPAGLGLVVLEAHMTLERSEYLGHATNNIAELTAILRVIDAVPDPTRPLVVHTDSQYSIGVLSKGWKAKKNQSLVAELRERIAERRAFRVVYVPGHAGVFYNERADALAREAVTSRSTNERRLPPRETSA